MSVRIASRIQRVFEPWSSGEAVRISPIRFHLHDVPVNAAGNPRIDRALRQRTLNRAIEVAAGIPKFNDPLLQWPQINMLLAGENGREAGDVPPISGKVERKNLCSR